MNKEIKKIKLFNNEYQLLIIRKNIKNTYIRVDDNVIVVSTNYFTSYSYIESLIRKNQQKIIKIMDKKISSNQILYLGKVYQIIKKKSNRFSYDILPEKVIFYTNLSLDETLELFYKKEAKKILPLRLQLCYNHFNRFNNIKYPNLSIRKMKRRLGTCYYTKNKICLNCFLVKYEERYIDYVIYHELSHFIHHNHSQNFYRQLEKVCPDYKILKNKINTN